TFDPVVVAMSSAFVPFPASVAVTPPPRRKVEYATGLIVDGDGHVVTDRQTTEDCQVISVAAFGNADRVAEDTNSGLALLRVYGARDRRAMAFAGDVKVTWVTLAGIADPQVQDGGSTVTTVKARVGDAAAGQARPLEEPLALGFSGAAALDGQGQLVGMAV